ncbi:ISSfl2 ORF [Shigella sonnei]|nr:ISSfl2 ORF [Shigella sonnei]
MNISDVSGYAPAIRNDILDAQIKCNKAWKLDYSDLTEAEKTNVTNANSNNISDVSGYAPAIRNDILDAQIKCNKAWFFCNDSNLLIVFYVQIMPDDFVMQLHRF